MTLKGSSSQACAACKYRRQKCTSHCLLAPFFPPAKAKLFQSVHKLFGVRNMVRIIENLDKDQKEEAMRSIIYQANARDLYPVHGCWGIICHLHFQIRQAQQELHAVHQQLGLHRHRQISSLTNNVSQFEFGTAPPSPTALDDLTFFSHTTLQHQQQQPYSNDSTSLINDSSLQSYAATNYRAAATNGPLAIDQSHDQLLVSHPQQEPEESLDDTTQAIEHVAENELKSAAACFSLTSVN